MNKKLSIIFKTFLFLAVFLFFQVILLGKVEAENLFTIESGALTAYSGSEEYVEIPAGVTTINSSVFSGNSTLKRCNHVGWFNYNK